MTWAAGWWTVSAVLLVAATLVVLDGAVVFAGWLIVGSAAGVLIGGTCNRRQRRHLNG